MRGRWLFMPRTNWGRPSWTVLRDGAARQRTSSHALLRIVSRPATWPGRASTT